MQFFKLGDATREISILLNKAAAPLRSFFENLVKCLSYGGGIAQWCEISANIISRLSKEKMLKSHFHHDLTYLLCMRMYVRLIVWW